MRNRSGDCRSLLLPARQLERTMMHSAAQSNLFKRKYSCLLAIARSLASSRYPKNKLHILVSRH
ncbi:hypothetical protein D3C85_1917870 [compost metagenome]